MSRRLVYAIIPVTILVILVALLVVASSGTGNSEGPSDGNQADTPSGPAESNAQLTTEPLPSALAWEQSGSGGRLVAYRSEELPRELAVFGSEQVSRVQRCSHAYRDEEGAVLFIGRQRGDLVYYPFDSGDPIPIGQTHRLTCAGPDTLVMSGDRVAYLRFDDGVISRSYRAGDLVIYDRAAQAEVITLDHVASFQVGGEVVMLRLFPNGAGDAAEADITRWSAERGLINVATLTPLPPNENAECSFAAGAVARVQTTAYALLGQRCNPGGSSWRLIGVSLEDGSTAEIAAGESVGSFYSDNFSLQLLPAQDGSGLLVAIPSGMERNVVTLFWVRLDGAITPVAEFALADRLGGVELEGRHLLRSPDGRWLAYAQLSRRMDQSLHLLDLSTAGTSSAEILALGANEQIVDYRWGPGSRLYFIEGGAESRSLRVVVPGSAPDLILRGQFTALEVSSSGRYVAVSERIAGAGNRTASQIALVDLSGGRIALSPESAPGVEAWVLGAE